MNALIYIVDTLLSLALFAFIARLLLQWGRADFRNPLCQAIVRVTNPVVMPLRRILPPIRKTDTASVVAVILVAFVKVSVLFAMSGAGWPDAPFWLRAVAVEIVRAVLSAYFYAIILYALLSMVSAGGYSPYQSVLASLCEPVLRPFRRVIPPIAGVDLSPLWACIAIQAILLLVH